MLGDDKELDSRGYPRYKDSKILVHHRQIMKKHNIDRLERGWVCHHIDGNKMNWRKDNLIHVRQQDHNDIERYYRKAKNLNIAYFFLVGVSFVSLLICKFFGGLWSDMYFIFGMILLFFAVILRLIPHKLLRLILFKSGILSRNKTKN